MEPYNLNPRAEALRCLDIAEKLLSTKDLVGSKSFATRARDSDPRLEQADQILAVTDTLLAAENPITNNHLDWYAILQLARRTHDSELIASQYRRLALLLNPNRNKFAFADHAFKLISEAWLVLSNPSRKFQFDSEIGNGGGSNNTHFNFNFIQQHHEPPPPQQQQQEQNGTHFNFIQEHHEPQQVSNHSSTHYNFIQEHHEPHHQLPLQLQQQQFMPPFHQQQTLAQQQSQGLNLHHLHETATIASPTPTHSAPLQPLSRPHSQQHFPWPQQQQQQQPQPQELLTRTQPQSLPTLFQSHLQPQQFLSQPQPQPQPLLQPRQPSPQSQPRQPSPKPQPQPRQPQPKPQPQQPSPQPQPQQTSPHFQPQQQKTLAKPQPPKASPLHQPQQNPVQPQPQQPLMQPQTQQSSVQPQQQEPSVQPQPQQPSSQSQPQLEPPFFQPQEQANGGNVRKDKSILTGEAGQENDDHANNDLNDKDSTFWTACPYCFHMYEYHRVYVESALLCQKCKRAFQAVVIPDPPLSSDGKDSFYCWVNFPFGVSMSYLEKNKNGRTNWTPFSTMFACPLGGSSANAGKQENAKKSSAPRIYVDDDHEVFVEVSSSDDSDDEWGSTRKTKKAKTAGSRGRSQGSLSRRRQA